MLHFVACFIIRGVSLSVHRLHEYNFLGLFKLKASMDVSFNGIWDCTNSGCEIECCGLIFPVTEFSSDVCSLIGPVDGWIITDSEILMIHENDSTPEFLRVVT